MKKQPVNSTKKQTYIRVGKNIYKTGSRYRVRVGKFSAYEPTLKKARQRKTLLQMSQNSAPIW